MLTTSWLSPLDGTLWVLAGPMVRFSATSAVAGYCAPAKPLLRPGSPATRNSGRPVAEVPVEQPVGPPLGEHAELGERDRHEVHHEGDRLAVEVRAVEDLLALEEQRVVVGGVQLDLERSAAWYSVSRTAPRTCGIARSV